MTNVQQDRRQTLWSVGDDIPIERVVGDRLHDYYEPMTRKPLPDRFLDLLRRADRKRIALHLTSRKA
jgi:Anti-sigma factor NepR